MAVGRQLNVKGQMRVDVPHMRILESGVVYDFDTLAGQMLTGRSPYIITGFAIASWTAGTAASSLQITTANSVVFNWGASENGTMLFVPADRAPETLAVTNSRVTGGFTASQTNYVGIDFIRSEDSTTSDIVQFLDATSLTSTPKTIPLGRTLDYRIVISTTPFSTTTNICPVAKVVTDASNNIVSVTDARTMYFRLALGGDSPNPLGVYSWPQGRANEVTTVFTGGDKAITNEKDWKSAIMTRIWEVTGGEYWYSDTTDRNVRFSTVAPAVLSDNVTATLVAGPALTIKWEKLYVVLSNSTASFNTILDSSGLTYAPNALGGGCNLAAGDCLYVDIDRTTNLANLTPVKGTIANLNAVPPTRVGSRYIIVWVESIGGTLYAYSRFNSASEVGRVLPLATTAVTGILRTSTADQIGGVAYSIVADAVGGNAIATGLTRGSIAAGILGVGLGANDSSVSISKAGAATTVFGSLAVNQGITSNTTVTNGTGITATGNGTGAGISGTGGAVGAAGVSGIGVIGVGGVENAAGTIGGYGGSFTGGAGVGVSPQAGSALLATAGASPTQVTTPASAILGLGTGNYTGLATAGEGIKAVGGAATAGTNLYGGHGIYSIGGVGGGSGQGGHGIMAVGSAAGNGINGGYGAYLKVSDVNVAQLHFEPLAALPAAATAVVGDMIIAGTPPHLYVCVVAGAWAGPIV